MHVLHGVRSQGRGGTPQHAVLRGSGCEHHFQNVNVMLRNVVFERLWPLPLAVPLMCAQNTALETTLLRCDPMSPLPLPSPCPAEGQHAADATRLQ